MAVSGEGEAVVQVRLGLVVLDVAGIDLCVEEPDAPGDAVLFGGEQVERDGSGVVGLQELGSFVAERVAFGGVGVAFLPGGGVEPVELGGDEFPQRGDDVLGYLHVAVVVLDGGFDVGDEHGLAFAGGALGVPARAQEVGVDHSLTAAGVGQDQPGAALAAEDAAFEVVVVGLGLLPGSLVRGEDGLDAVPDFGGDERFVQPVVGGAPEADLSLVVRVGQHLLDRGQRRGLRRPLRCRHARQSSVDQFLVQGDGRVVPGGVSLERPLDQRGTVGIGLDHPHFAAQLVALADVEVADGCLAVGSAGERLLVHALGDLVGEVAGVELRDGGHDAVQQHPARGFVNVLGGRDEHDPGLLQGQMDRHVVGAVAGEPVDLVDDAVRDRMGLDVLDHSHQVGPVGLAGGLAGIDELFGDDRVELACLAQVRLPLRRDREAFVPAAAFGLFLGRDTQVGHRQAGRLAHMSESGRRCRLCDGHGSCFLPQQMGPTRAMATARAVRLVGKHDPERSERSALGKPRRLNRTCAPRPRRSVTAGLVRLRFYLAIGVLPRTRRRDVLVAPLVVCASEGHADEQLGELVQVGAGERLGLDAVRPHPCRRCLPGLAHWTSPVVGSTPAKKASSAACRAATSSRT
ncbi:MAG: hypothetical protein QM624_19645 [Micropruina sp.]